MTQLGLNVALTFYTCRLIKNMSDFFAGQFKNAQRMLIVVTLIILLVSTLSLINDFAWTIWMTEDAEDTDD